jgi:beta-xylosidase
MSIASLVACVLVLLVPCLAAAQAAARAPRALAADNGNGTFSNPLFHDELSDPDLIRVGDDFYLTGTTMHAMPGLPVLHSRDLVNWELLSYAVNRLDLGPAYRLEEGRQIYGRGIWAPSFRYHRGTFHIFSNVNGQTTQHFTATDPRGPWTRTAMKRSFHDLSVLFDDDGKTYVVWGYRDMRFAQLDDGLTDVVPGTERVLFDTTAGMGEGAHFYKIRGRYYITSAWYAGRMRMPAARADRPEGPYEVNREISADEDFGVVKGHRLRSTDAPPFQVVPPDPGARGQISLHQGGIVDTPTGEWWGFSMIDYNSVGRLTALSPVTWQDGWPYFGLPGNLGRTPRVWVKPNTGATSAARAPYERSDDFAGPRLRNVWQWNHVPDDTRWSLAERPGYLRLHALPAPELWWARNTLTQRAVGPRSSPTAVLETAGMRPGDVAGLALVNFPYAWIGVRRDSTGSTLDQFDQTTGRTERRPLRGTRVWLRAECDFLTEKARFSYSTDGAHFVPLGGEFTMVFQLRTFQGVRYGLFHYNAGGAPGGHADFDAMTVHEPDPRGITRPIPIGRTITLATAVGEAPLVVGERTGSARPAPSALRVVDRGRGRVALRAPGGWLSVATDGEASRVILTPGAPGDAETFQWVETPYGDVALLSLATHRYLRVDPERGTLSADHRGPEPGRADGAQFRWVVGGAGRGE